MPRPNANPTTVYQDYSDAECSCQVQAIDSSVMGFIVHAATLGVAVFSKIASTWPGHRGWLGHDGEFSDTFQGNKVDSFPRGWGDAALVSPIGNSPVPSAAVVRTSDAFG